MGANKKTPLEKWLYHFGPVAYGILQKLAEAEDWADESMCPTFVDLAKQARMALEAPNLGGPPPLDWRKDKLV
jgi:hypothetical protein